MLPRRPEWTWEQWRGTPHSPKLQHCWNLTIRLFSVISRTLVRGGTLQFQTIQFSISTTVSLSKTVLFQTIQFSISPQISSIWPLDRTLSGTTTPGQSGLGSDGNEGVLRIPQSSITGTSPSNCLISYQDTCWGGGLTPLQSVYSTADWAIQNVFYALTEKYPLECVCNFVSPDGNLLLP